MIKMNKKAIIIGKVKGNGKEGIREEEQREKKGNKRRWLGKRI